MPDDAVGLLFNEITAERGGQQTFSVVALSLARQLAVMLVNPASKADPAAVARLLEMLPAKSAEPPLDLSRLSDKQLNDLEAICAVAKGEAPPPRQRKRKRKLPAQTPRQIEAVRLAALLDAADTAGELTDNDANEARNSIGSLLFPLATLARLVPPELFVTAAPPPTPEPEMPKPEPKPAAANVVPLHRVNDLYFRF
jgi:hypothetical protein